MAARTRIARLRLTALARQFPAVALLGPRQIGKSTLAKLAFPEYAHFDLEDPLDRARLTADPLLVFEEHPRLVLDEVQRAPELFPILRSHLDRRPRARVILLGSAAPGLLSGVSESLAGRVGFLELGGLSILEANQADLWLKGSFPRVHWSRPRARPGDWYPAYLRACLETDIPQLGFSISSLRLHNLITMVAHAQGGLLNLSAFGGSLGVSYHTVAHLLEIFEGIFLLRRLQPYAANLRKRLVKSPKLYVRDTGLLHSLLGISHERRALLAHPKAGASFESFCIEQLILHAQLVAPESRAFFFRTHAGHEVDLLLELRGELIPIEVKLGLGPPEVGGLETCMRELGLERGYVVYAGSGALQLRRSIVLCGLGELLGLLQLMPGPRKGRQPARSA